MRKRNHDNLFLGLAIVVFICSLVGTFNTYFQIAGLYDSITGHAIDTGSVNVTVRETIVINFTSDNVNWGSGAVLEGHPSARIDTWGNIDFGSWNPVAQGLVIRNEGNVNVTLNLTSGKNAASFIGGSSPSYKFKVNDVEEGACIPPSGFSLNETYDSGTERRVCDLFVANTSVRVDIELTIPSDSDLGILSDTLRVRVQQA
jgi:hypothetical protein